MHTQNLYIAAGDGGGPNDSNVHGQNRAAFLGKILRIAVPTAEKAAAPYTIPADNPYQPGNAGGYLPEIYAYG